MKKAQQKTFELAAFYGEEQISSFPKQIYIAMSPFGRSTVIKLLIRKAASQRTSSNYVSYFTQTIVYPEIC